MAEFLKRALKLTEKAGAAAGQAREQLRPAVQNPPGRQRFQPAAALAGLSLGAARQKRGKYCLDEERRQTAQPLYREDLPEPRKTDKRCRLTEERQTAVRLPLVLLALAL